MSGEPTMFEDGTPAPARAQRQRMQDATWFRVLDRFGLPTLLVLLLLGDKLRTSEADRRERVELLTGIKKAIEVQTNATLTLAQRQEDFAQAVRLTWPKVRIPAPAPRDRETTP